MSGRLISWRGGAGQGGQTVEGGGELVSPGPGCREPQVEAAAAAGGTGNDVRDAVVEIPGFGGSSRLAVQ
ncbi:hypothetical protein GCM10010433_53280 [Streptomyces pulveraceus]